MSLSYIYVYMYICIYIYIYIYIAIAFRPCTASDMQKEFNINLWNHEMNVCHHPTKGSI